MGSPKQLLKWKSTTLIGHSIQTALNTPVKDIVVVLGAHYALVKKEVDQFPVEVVKNKDWDQGLGKSIACGVEYIMDARPHTSGILMMLADQPLIDAGYLNTMINTFDHDQDQIIATAYNHGKQGVPALFDTVYFEALSHLNDDKGAKYLLKKHQQHVRTLKPLLENIDIDDETDYERFTK